MHYLCQPCKKHDREQVAHRIVGATPMCEWCWKGEPHPEEIARARAAESVGRKQPACESRPRRAEHKKAEGRDEPSNLPKDGPARKRATDQSPRAPGGWKNPSLTPAPGRSATTLSLRPTSEQLIWQRIQRMRQR